MRAILLLQWRELGAKYWFIPSLMALGAIVLSFVVVYIDGVLGSAWLSALPWGYANEPSGARALLSTIAGSMITVAGVTFSITTAAVAQTAANFGPRLITNFMADRGNQITLGTFIATFLFCILVLRTVRSGDDQLEPFVPHAAILCALALALASLGVLIYFIHHVPESIHISNVVARIGRDLAGSIERLFPEMLGDGDDDEVPPPEPPRRAVPVRAKTSGYVEYIDASGLMERTVEHDLLVFLERAPGDFVAAGQILLWADGPTPLDERIGTELRRTYVIGGYRSSEQDVLFLVNRLVEVAGRALSPGMNDVFTAINAIDWLGGALIDLAGRKVPDPDRHDRDGRVRVIARPRTYRDIADAILDQLRPYVARDRNAALHLLRTLAEVGRATPGRHRRAILLGHAEVLHAAAKEALGEPRDRAALDEALEAAVRTIERPRDQERATA